MTRVVPGQPAESVETGGSRADTQPPLCESDLHFTRFNMVDPPTHLRVVHRPTGINAQVEVGSDETYMQARRRLKALITQAVHSA